MRLAHSIVFASLLAAPAMAADVVVTTPGAVAPPAVVGPPVVAPPAVVATPAPGVVVTPGPSNAERHLDEAARAQANADQARGIAEEQQEKADRHLDKADSDSTGTVVVTPR
jgi:hypothetical protein